MTSKKTLVTLQFSYENRSLEDNFKTLKQLIEKTPKNSLVVAPELCLGGYRYDSLKESAYFSKKILFELEKLSTCRTIALTLIEERDGNYYNNLKIFHHRKLIQSRPKARLFPIGNEEKYFVSGKIEEIDTIEIDGIKIATLICFELRFTELWQKILGADIILVPSYWGKPRKEQLELLSCALAVANQAFVVVSNSSDEGMASSSAIITPFGDKYIDDSKSILKREVNLSEIKKMRTYLDIGLK